MTALNKTHAENSEFESPPPHMPNPRPSGVSGFFKAYGDKMGTRKYLYYKPPKLAGNASKRFVELYYRVPKELTHLYPNIWKRFKIYKDINREGSKEYENHLLELVKYCLENGWNPFQDKIEVWAEGTEQRKVWTIQQGISFFLQNLLSRGLEQSSVDKYKRACLQFQNWLNVRGQQNAPAEEINFRHIEAFLTHYKTACSWTNSTYNGTRSFLSTAFSFMVKRKIVSTNPCTGTSKLKVVTKKHRYYDPGTLEKLKIELIKRDPYLLFAFQAVYYLCIRAEKELCNLRVKDILKDRMQVFVNAGKTGDRFIPLAKEMLAIFEGRNVFDYPGEYYVFSVPHKNKFVLDGTPGQNKFGTGFFSKRFKKIREDLKLDSAHTLYSMKHTRIIHLKTDGVKDADIMSLTGHKDFAAYSIYLRDLNLTANPQELQRLTRKF